MERRVYKHVCIWRDESGWYNPATFKTYHWFVSVCHSIASGISKQTREYFPTIASAKRFILSYYEETARNLQGGK